MNKLIVKTKKLPFLYRMWRILLKIEDRVPVKIKGGEIYVTEMANETTAVSFSFNAYKKTQKQVVLFWKYSKTGVVECHCKACVDIFGVLTYGIFRSPLNLEVEVLYK